MSYATGCTLAPRVNVFSSPLKTYAGKVQGTTTADNARVLNEAVVSNGCLLICSLRSSADEINP